MSSKTESIILHLLSNLNPQIHHYCDLETVDGDPGDAARKIPNKQILIYQDGSCASILKLNGIKNLMSLEDFENLVVSFTQTLEPFLRLKGHQVQCLYRRDLDALDQLNAIGSIQKASAKQLKLNVDDLIDESVEKYSQYVYEEDCYIVLYSRPALLDKIEMKMDRDKKSVLRKTYEIPSMVNGQNLLRPVSYLYDRHIAFVSKVYDDLTSHYLGVSVEQMDIKSMLRDIKRVANRNGTNPLWEPSIPGNGIAPRWNEGDDIGEGGIVTYPPLAEQILNEPAMLGKARDKNLPDEEFIRIGDRVYAPIVLEVPPRTDNESFNNLFNALNRAETIQNGERKALPYSLSFMMEGDGMGFTLIKSIFSQFLSFTSEQNRNINASMRELKEYVRDHGCVVKFRIAAMTWSDSDIESVNELKLRKSKLKNAIEGWSGASWKSITGDAAVTWRSNNLGLSPKHNGNPCAAPLESAVQLLPITRPASAFAKGTILNRSLDGSILPLERFSSAQTTWVTLAVGKPGSGKSVLLNNFNFEACVSPGIKRLPYVGIIDIGISSLGFIDLIRDGLPPEQQYQVVYRRIQNTEKYGINVMDTPLLQRMPLKREMTFKINFITALVTPPESDRPKEGMTAFVARVLKEAYLLCQDDIERGQPKKYTRYQNKTVDESLVKLGHNLDDALNMTYWEIAEQFFDQKMYYECEVAQRYAVPTLNDLGHAAHSETINSEFSHEEGQRLRSAFVMGLRDAIDQYEIFRGITQFDLGAARVVSIDLQDVAGKDPSPASVKQTTLMYMIARQSFMQKLAYSKEDLDSFSPKAKPYYERIISELVEEEKILMYDEFHKTQTEVQKEKGGSPSVLQQQVFTDGREARKWKMEIVLGSQLLADFGLLTKIATNIYLLDASTPQERNTFITELGITRAAASALEAHVHGPGRHGTTFLAVTDTVKGRYCQLYTLTLGAMRLWSLSTTAEDRKMREIFYANFEDRKEARAALASYFPDGSCKAYVENEKRRMALTSDENFISDEEVSGMVEAIAKRCIDDYYSRLNAA